MPVDLTPLANVGAVGLILAWFLFQTSPRLERIERAVDVLSKAILLDIVSRDGVTISVKQQAEGMIRQVEAKYQAKTSP